ncbi:hypothetical protein F5Y16DRAFT_383816 [Xylariaceae sp. FL0255]|nr:hypothetical protein F5Y16DRAFT_383816 [Xylariaceae sp. FL0255]
MPQRRRRYSSWDLKYPLHSLLVMLENCQASISRDQTYALLSMCNDIDIFDKLHPCYKKSEDEVLRNTASVILFGELLVPSYSLPDFAFHELCFPLSLLAEKILSEFSQQETPFVGRKVDTANLLVDRIQHGSLTQEDQDDELSSLVQS